MARSGMGTIIAKVRAKARLGTADYTINSVAYWTDDQIQEILDANRKDVFRHALRMVATYDDGGGTARYRHYYFAVAAVERAESGTVAWEVKDSTGNLIGTANYTVNYDTGLVRFTNDQRGTAYYLNYRTYDLDATAADIWEQKAADLTMTGFDIKTEGHTFSRSQMMDSYLRMADRFRSKAGLKPYEFVRGDM